MRPIRFDPKDRLRVRLDSVANHFVFDMWADHGTFKSGASARLRDKFVQRFPQFRYDKHAKHPISTVHVALTDISAQLLRAHFGPQSLATPLQIHFEQDARIAYDYLLGTVFNQDRCANFIANFRAGNPCRTELLLNDKLPLAPYQMIGAQCALWSEGFALFMEQGTGKTATAIARVCTQAAVKFSATGKRYRGIIVCPKGVRIGWQEEFLRFAPAGVTVLTTVVRGDKLDRTKHIIDAFIDETHTASMLIMSYEALASMYDTLARLTEQTGEPWDIALLDESHYIKSNNAQRSKAAIKLRDIARHRMCLTGTPIVNGINDLYTQLEFLGKGFSGFSTFDAFKEFHNVYEITDNGHRAIVGAQNVPFMRERLAKVSYIIRKKEALPDLPEKVYDVSEVEMIPEQIAAYEKLAKDLVLQAEGQISAAQSSGNTFDRQMTANNILTQMLRLAQITSGFVKWDQVIDPATGRVIREGFCQQFSPNPKIDAIIEHYNATLERAHYDGVEPWEKMIVWCNWTEDIQALSRRLEEVAIKHVTYYGSTTDANREEAKRRFNCEPDTLLLIGNAAAGGAGLNLIGAPPEAPDSVPTACTREIYMSQGWSPVLRAQSEDRAHRKGTKVQVTITDLCVPGTIDETIRARVLEKRMNALTLTDVSEILAKTIEGLKRL